MVAIRPLSATIAAIYTHFIIFVVVSVFNFTILDNTLPIRFGYGVCLIVISLTSLLLGITSQDQTDALLRSFLMTISALWTSIGVFHVVEYVVNTGVSDSEALFSGYLTFLLVSLFFIFGGLHHKDKFSSILALGMFLSCIFEIASLWKPVRRSAGAYYLLMAAMTLYLTMSKLWNRFRRGESRSAETFHEEGRQSKDYIPVGHAMNVLAAAAFACQATGIYDRVVVAFSWVIVAGIYQIIVGVVAVRRNHIYNAMYFFFHGLFWLTNGFNLLVSFSTQDSIPYLIAATVIYFIIFACIAAISLTRELFQMLQSTVICILCVAILVDVDSLAFVSVMGWILFLLALYTLAAHISRVQNSGWKLPLGAKLISVQQLSEACKQSCPCLESRGQLNEEKQTKNSKGSSTFSIDFTLGYSRYGGFDLAGFAINAVAALAIVWTPEGLWILPWSIVLGGLSSMVIGSLCFAKGLSFESCAFFTFGALWMIWGPARGFGNLEEDNSAAVITGCVGFLAVGLLLLGLSSTISKAWTAVTFFFNLIIIGILLNAINANGAFIYEIVISILFVIVCMYCFVAFSLKMVWGKEVLPLGKPFLQVSYLHSQGPQAFWADGRTASGVRSIADIMNKGGICGIPTDVVYVLVAALKFPKAIERAYNTKKLAEDRPMSMWISKVEQIEEGRALFGEMVWGLMNEIWPSTVSLVVPKGDWYDNLGVGESGKYIGRPDSIACRMPDNTVTSHLIDQTGPIAVTSANPTGEADTTHHLQVLAKLGLKNVDGILCSGPSPENMASTVVDCRNLNEGKIGFFRIGVVPRSHVEAVVAKVRAYHDGSILPSISRTSMGDHSHVNEAFEDIEITDEETRRSNENGQRTTHSNKTDDRNSQIGDSTDDSTNVSEDGNPRNSFNVSFAESTTEDNANLIHDSTSTDSGSGSANIGPFNDITNKSSNDIHLSGHTNKVYETLVATDENKDNDVNTIYESRLSTSSGHLRSSKSSSNDPYEPMQVKATNSAVELVSAKSVIGGYNDEKQPEFKMNPIFEMPTLRTKM